MPIFIEPPKHDPAGVDGRGHNRLALLGFECLPKCALRPEQESTFWESLDTRRAGYHAYGNCSRDGDCQNCPRFHADQEWKWSVDELVVRVDEDDKPWIMSRPDDGWGEWGLRVSWEYLRTVQATFERGKDEHGKLIWMRRTTPTKRDA